MALGHGMGVWRYVWVGTGELCVRTCLKMLTQLLPAETWVIPRKVSFFKCMKVCPYRCVGVYRELCVYYIYVIDMCVCFLQMHLQCPVVHLVGVRECGYKVSSVREWSRTSHTVSLPVQDTSSPAQDVTPPASGVLVSHINTASSVTETLWMQASN